MCKYRDIVVGDPVLRIFHQFVRFVFRSLRRCGLAIMITLSGWVLYVPATAAEHAILKGAENQTRPGGLMELRIAQMKVDFAPEKCAYLWRMIRKGELTPDFANMIQRRIASAKVGTESPASGAKFVPVGRP